MLSAGQDPDADQLAAIVDLCAWAHAEWIRIHPFANGNGRTARLWANCIAMRYGLPPFIRLRPRPNDGYAAAGAKAMQGNWEQTAAEFRRLLFAFLDSIPDQI
jgi:Fic family protein